MLLSLMTRLERNFRMSITCKPWIPRVIMIKKDTFMHARNHRNWVIIFTKALTMRKVSRT